MASHYYGMNVGDHATDLVLGTSTGSTDVEIRVDDTNVTTRQQLVEAIDQLRIQIQQQSFPLA